MTSLQIGKLLIILPNDLKHNRHQKGEESYDNDDYDNNYDDDDNDDDFGDDNGDCNVFSSS